MNRYLRFWYVCCLHLPFHLKNQMFGVSWFLWEIQHFTNRQWQEVCGHWPDWQIWVFLPFYILPYLDCNFKTMGIKMSLHGRMIDEKIGREAVRGSHQWNSTVIHIGIFFCVQQLPGKGEKQWDKIVCLYMKTFRLVRMREGVRNEVRKTL